MSMNQSIFINKLNKIRYLNKKDAFWVNQNIYRLIYSKQALLSAYQLIKSNKGALTAASENDTLDKWSLLKIENLHEKLRNESWKPKPARRVYIPKPGKVEKRRFEIQGVEEEIVETVLKIVLESIYEPCFIETSYGFRQERGVHDALKSISINYDGMRFAIEAHIKGIDDTVNAQVHHHKLVSLLEKKINDPRTIRLIWKLLGAGYMDRGNIINGLLARSQASIVSPIFANVYLHQFDLFMQAITRDIKKRSPNIKPSQFKVVQAEMRKLNKAMINETNQDEKKLLVKRFDKCKLKSLKITPYCDQSEKIHYVRYADDFIVGMAISKEKADETEQKIREFLKSLHLTLSDDKTKITNLKRQAAIFLGHKIQVNTSVKMQRVGVKNRSPYLRRVTAKFIKITARLENIVRRLHEKGFCDRKGNPTHKIAWISQQDSEIISLFNATSRGLFGFYSGVDQKRRLTWITYIFKYSCAATLAAKHRTSLSKIFAKHGQDLVVRYGENGKQKIQLFKPLLKRNENK